MDIAMCENDKCDLKDECLRFIGIPSEYRQSYLANPKEDCEEKNYKLFYRRLRRY